MSLARIYQPLTLKVGEEVCLDEKAQHHLGRVLRAKKGDQVTLFNGEGGEYVGCITFLDKKNITVQLNAFDSREAESTINICLAQGMARGEKMDFIIQKAVELGVNSIVPLITTRCNVQLEGARAEKRLQHWQAVAISAAEQCGRNRIPAILPITPLDAFLEQNQKDYGFVLSPHVANKAFNLQPQSGQKWSLVIGPEGGLSDEEVERCVQNTYSLLQLGPRVLRTETAPLVALSVLQSRYGDLT